MKLLPDFLTSKLGRKPSENFIRASERAKLRRSQELNFDGLFPETERNDQPARNEPVSRFSGFDAKTLVMAVSLVANAGLVGVLYGKSAASDENEFLKKEVSSLRVEKAKMSRASEGKITLAPNQRVVTVETLQSFTSSAQETIDTARALSSRVLELEGRLAKYEGKKRASMVENPSLRNEAMPNAVPMRDSAAYAKSLEVVKSVSHELPDGVSLKVTQNAGLTAVTYSDTSGFIRYFTADRSENASKLTKKGLQAWVSEKYVASLDVQAKKEGVLK